MKAVTFQGANKIKVEAIADPVIEHPADVVVKIKLCAICGSDLHVYNGIEKGCDHGTAMGHEFVGEVVETGSAVSKWKAGDLVMSPFSTNCGQCENCKRGLTSRCIQSQLFGWRENHKGLHGGQAEFIRVPLSESTLLPVPNKLSLEQALLLGDVIPTGYFCAYQADIKPDGVYVVIGCGAVGLMAVAGALALGASRVYAIDTIQERLELASSLGALPLNSQVQLPVQIIREASKGLGADAVMEAVGNNQTVRLAYELVRAGGVISMVGVNNESALPFSPSDLYNKNVTIKVGRCPARFFMEKLIPLVASNRFDYTKIISHRMPLHDGVEGYRIFSQKVDNCTKVVLYN